MIVNLITGDVYVGSAVTGKLPYRFHKHLFGFSGSKLVAAAVSKYGLSHFAYVIVETLPKVVTSEDNKELLDLEDYYLTNLKPIYNVSPNATNTLGVKHTEAAKLKMRLNYSSERREKIGALNRGKTLSATTIEAIRKAALAKEPMTDATRAKVSANSRKAYLNYVGEPHN